MGSFFVETGISPRKDFEFTPCSRTDYFACDGKPVFSGGGGNHLDQFIPCLDFLEHRDFPEVELASRSRPVRLREEEDFRVTVLAVGRNPAAGDHGRLVIDFFRNHLLDVFLQHSLVNSLFLERRVDSLFSKWFFFYFGRNDV